MMGRFNPLTIILLLVALLTASPPMAMAQVSDPGLDITRLGDVGAGVILAVLALYWQRKDYQERIQHERDIIAEDKERLTLEQSRADHLARVLSENTAIKTELVILLREMSSDIKGCNLRVRRTTTT